jgi:hypothetical protein
LSGATAHAWRTGHRSPAAWDSSVCRSPKAYSYKSYGRGGWASSSEAVVDATLVVMGVVGKGARATVVREQGWLIGLDGKHRAKQVTLARRQTLEALPTSDMH